MEFMIRKIMNKSFILCWDILNVTAVLRAGIFFALVIRCHCVQEQTGFVWQCARKMEGNVVFISTSDARMYCSFVKWPLYSQGLSLDDGSVLRTVTCFVFLSSMTFMFSLYVPLLKYEFQLMQFSFPVIKQY